MIASHPRVANSIAKQKSWQNSLGGNILVLDAAVQERSQRGGRLLDLRSLLGDGELLHELIQNLDGRHFGRNFESFFEFLGLLDWRGFWVSKKRRKKHLSSVLLRKVLFDQEKRNSRPLTNEQIKRKRKMNPKENQRGAKEEIPGKKSQKTTKKKKERKGRGEKDSRGGAGCKCRRSILKEFKEGKPMKRFFLPAPNTFGPLLSAIQVHAVLLLFILHVSLHLPPPRFARFFFCRLAVCRDPLNLAHGVADWLRCHGGAILCGLIVLIAAYLCGASLYWG